MVGASGSGAGSELTLEAGTAKSTDMGGAVNIRGGPSSQGAGGDLGLVSGSWVQDPTAAAMPCTWFLPRDPKERVDPCLWELAQPPCRTLDHWF